VTIHSLPLFGEGRVRGETVPEEQLELDATGPSGQASTLSQPLPQGRGAALGTMRLVRGAPNPNGAEDTRLFLLSGDPTAAPIRNVIPAHGVTIPPPPNLADPPFRLCILHFNDLHGHMARPTPHGNEAVFARMVWRVREMRRRSRDDPCRGVLFLSGGDDLVGAVLGELLGDDPASYAVHAGYHLYSAAGVDVGVVGNHDLDVSTRLLAHAIERDARFPLLSANLRATPPLAGRVYPAALLVVKGIRVGIVGLTTSAEVRCAGGSDFCLTHPVTAIQNLLPALQPLCDVLIVLSHLGHSLASSTATTRDAGDVELASSLPAGTVHLIVGGHTHEALNESGLSVTNLVNGIPIVQAGAMGRFLGEVDITIGPKQAARSCVSVASVHLIPTADLPVDEDFQREQVQPLLERARPLLAQRLGQVVDHPDLTPEAVRCGFAAGESALANLITDAVVTRCRAAGYAVDLAAIDASSIRGGLPVGGELTFGDWFNLMPCADTVRIYRMTGQQLAALVDDNARRADLPGEPHVERGFLQFSGQVRYTIDRAENRRAANAVHVTVGGLSLDRQLERTFLVAYPSFVREAATPWERYARHQLGLPVLDTLGALHADTDLLVRDVLIAHIRTHDGVTEKAGARRDGRLSVVSRVVESLA
jgi:5'-nucleotidase/UDP-sugar diphosphatase